MRMRQQCQVLRTMWLNIFGFRVVLKWHPIHLSSSHRLSHSTMRYTFIDVLGLVSLAAVAQSTQTVLSNALKQPAKPTYGWRLVACTQQMANDSGSGAYLNIATWAPPSSYKDDRKWTYLTSCTNGTDSRVPS
jgi:hypothetical protein